MPCETSVLFINGRGREPDLIPHINLLERASDERIRRWTEHPGDGSCGATARTAEGGATLDVLSHVDLLKWTSDERVRRGPKHPGDGRCGATGRTAERGTTLDIFLISICWLFEAPIAWWPYDCEG